MAAKLKRSGQGVKRHGATVLEIRELAAGK